MPETHIPSPNSEENALTQAAYRIWKNTHCQKTLLRWQDEYGVDINMVVALSWLEARNIHCNEMLLTALREICDAWREVLVPLRTARRRVKSQAADLYPLYQALELNTEHKALADLYQFTQNLPVSLLSFDQKHVDKPTSGHNVVTYLQQLHVDLSVDDKTVAATLIDILSD